MTTRSRYTAAITDNPWWLAGGIPQSACLVAYQPVGASSYLASKVNLATPGVNDAIDGTAYPTWDVNNGWKFDRISFQYLITIYHNVDQTVIVRYSNNQPSSYRALFGVEDRFEFFPYVSSGEGGYGFRHGRDVVIAEGTLSSGVAAINRNNGYHNGVLKTSALTGNTAVWRIAIGGRANNIDGSTANFFVTTYVKAFAIYSYKLADTQIVSLTNAMNAL